MGTVIVITQANVKFGDSAATIGTTGKDFSCQVNSAAFNATPNIQTVPATFCDPQGQTAAASGWELALTFLQDWQYMNGLSFYLADNDGVEKYCTVSLNAATQPLAAATVRIIAGTYGGDAGTPLQATVTLPVKGKPTFTKPPTALAADGTEQTVEEEEQQPETVAA